MPVSTDAATSAIGASVTIGQLERDPYPVYARLQLEEPVSWIASLGMWFVTRYEDVRTICMDSARFTTAFEHSVIFDTFGAQMLTTEGAQHDRYRAAVQPAFSAGNIRRQFEAGIELATKRLIEELQCQAEVDLRSQFAARLPIQTVLSIFGMPPEGEAIMRRWYDAFERALANFTHDPQIRLEAQRNVSEFHQYLDGAMRQVAPGGQEFLLAALVNAPRESRLSDEEIRRNLSIIFFGGISTVEALILNCLWALFNHPAVHNRVIHDQALIPKAIEETLRWMSPVQSATRHVVSDTCFRGISLKAGTVVNCMLGAANRDAAVFSDPEQFDLDRPNVQRHLGFATGTHSCLGFQLAKTEARIALRSLLGQLPGLTLVDAASSVPIGYEFRQPRSMVVRWSKS